jgi:hypothetical protein
MKPPGLFAVFVWISMVMPAMGGCGSSSGPPDTGYGIAHPVPAQLNCVDLCERIGDCAVHLCNEDTKSTRYTGLDSILALECEAGCTDALVQANLTSTQWQCLFQSSCRAVFGQDVCQTDGSYTCN